MLLIYPLTLSSLVVIEVVVGVSPKSRLNPFDLVKRFANREGIPIIVYTILIVLLLVPPIHPRIKNTLRRHFSQLF